MKMKMKIFSKKFHFFLKGSYGFVEFKNESDAEDAKEALNGKNYGGLPLIIEWSKRSGRFDPRDSRRYKQLIIDMRICCHEILFYLLI